MKKLYLCLLIVLSLILQQTSIIYAMETDEDPDSYPHVSHTGPKSEVRKSVEYLESFPLNSGLRSLTFKNCGELTQKWLGEDIGVGNIGKLVIENSNNLDDTFIKALESKNGGLKSLSLERLHNLTHLRLGFPKLTTLILKGCENVRTIEIDSPDLQKLVASGCPLLEEVKFTGTGLRFIDLSHNDALSDETLDALLDTQPKLKVLNVQHSQNISFSEVRSANPHYPVALLKNLEFSLSEVTNVSDHSAVEFIKELGAENFKEIYTFLVQLLLQDPQLSLQDPIQRLKRLKFHGGPCANGIGFEGARALSEGLKVNTTLQEFWLCSQSIGAEGARALSEVIKVNTTLQEMRLYYNSIGGEGAKALSEGLKVNTALKELSLDTNKIGTEGAIALSEALKVNTTLQNLDLRGNSIGDEGAIALSEALKVNTALKELFLNTNKIGAEGAIALSEGIKLNMTLQKLDLGGNSIGDEGAIALSEALKVNTALQNLDLYANKIGFEGAKALRKGIKLNTTLQKMYCGNNKIGFKGWEASIENFLSRNRQIAIYCDNNKIGFKGWEASIENFLSRNRQIAFSGKLGEAPDKEETSSPAFLRGISEGISFSLSPLGFTSKDFLKVLGLDRKDCIKQLSNMRNKRAFREILAIEIKDALLKKKFPVRMQNADPQNSDTYRFYVMCMLGSPLHHSLQGGSFKAIANLQGLSYVVWQKDFNDSSQLKKIDQVLTFPPIRHVLYTPSLAGNSYGRYELLAEEDASGSFVFPETVPSFEEDPEEIGLCRIS